MQLKWLPITLVLLSGCAATDSLPPPTTISCPAIREYSKDDQKTVAQELQNIPKDSKLAQFITDYGELRKEVRACQLNK